MLSKEEIENNRIPKQLAKALGIEKEDTDSLIAFKENLYEQTVRENIRLKKQAEQLELDKQKLIEKLEEDSKEQEWIYTEDDEYLAYTEKALYAEEILEILKGEKE